MDNTSATTHPIELIDVVDPTGIWLATETRTKVHSDGLWHNVFHCLIIRSTQPSRVVLQRRHRNSKAFPSKVDLSVTGHLSAGEQPTDGVREITEELGIDVDPAELIPVGVRLMADNSGEGANRERIHLHFLSDDRPIDTFAPSPEEVESLIEIEIDQVLHLLHRLEDDPTAAVDAIEWAPGAEPKPIRLAAAELVPPADGYWVTALIAAKRFATGDSPIAI